MTEAVANRSCPACLRAGAVTPSEPLDGSSFYVCGHCGAEHVAPLPEGVPVFQDFTDYARGLFQELKGGAPIAEALTPNEEIVLERMKRDLSPGDAVLELCCETGRFLAALKAHGFRPYGVDPLARPMELLREEGFPVEVGLVEAVPMEWPQPKAVVILESIVRFPEPVTLLRQVRERFPGATVYMTVPSPRRSLKLPDFDRRNAYPPHHLVRWTEKAMVAALEKAGYRAKGETRHVRVNWPMRRGVFGNTLSVALRLMGEAEYSHLAVGRPA